MDSMDDTAMEESTTESTGSTMGGMMGGKTMKCPGGGGMGEMKGMADTKDAPEKK
jgi:hypothetical protein